MGERDRESKDDEVLSRFSRSSMGPITTDYFVQASFVHVLWRWRDGSYTSNPQYVGSDNEHLTYELFYEISGWW